MNVEHKSLNLINTECCCFNLRKVSRAVTQYFDKHLEPAGIRVTQFTILVALSSTNARTLTEVAESLVMDRTTLTRNLRPLEKLSFITGTASIDKRSKAYVLTEEGRNILDRAMPYWEQAQLAVTGSIGADRYQHVMTELDSMLDVINMIKKHK